MNEAPKLRMRWTQLTLCALLLSINCVAGAQQINSDNQWVAPHGVGTVAATMGEEYSTLVFVAALVPEWEFNRVSRSASFT
jgi:hypothetical protein